MAAQEYTATSWELKSENTKSVGFRNPHYLTIWFLAKKKKFIYIWKNLLEGFISVRLSQYCKFATSNVQNEKEYRI